ncbi:hypothetical protein BGZ52_003239 [Haplosporangium bisporale]|nr:hypothetical protein BGZ52_003239 [Haplosporangium bisporale]
MTFKIASALALLVLAQAAPLVARCVGSACDQAAQSGNVEIGSTTNIAPVTNVTPITNYQPIVQANAPIVQSDCYNSHGYGGFGDYGLDLGGLGGHGDLGGYGGFGGYGGIGGYGMGGLYSNRLARFSRYGYGRGLNKRAAMDDTSAMDQAPQGNLLFSQFQSPSASACAPGDSACVANLPQQTVDLGSSVSAVPQTNVMPTTTYQSQVQALDSNIQAAPAQQNSLPQQSVNLGHNTFIQPTTQVLPQTSYQPTVNQLTTDIQAAPVQDQSLPQSSVQLGSSVNIAPSVTVTPLTTFQPSIQSLPIIINSAPCVGSSSFAGASSSMIASSMAPSMAPSMASSMAPIGSAGFQGGFQGAGLQGPVSGFQGSSFDRSGMTGQAQTLPSTGSACSYS